MATTSFRKAAKATDVPPEKAGKPVDNPSRPKLNAPVKGGGADYDPCPEGVHAAVIVGVYDVGTHHSERFNNDQRKLVVSFEVPGERIDIQRDGETVNAPRLVSKRYTLSLNAKANLRRDVHAIEGHALTDAEAETYDLFSLAGRACQIQVTHTKKDEKTFANVASVMALPKGMTAPKGEIEPTTFTVEGCDPNNLPEGMPGWVVELVKACAELNG